MCRLIFASLFLPSSLFFKQNKRSFSKLTNDKNSWGKTELMTLCFSESTLVDEKSSFTLCTFRVNWVPVIVLHSLAASCRGKTLKPDWVQGFFCLQFPSVSCLMELKLCPKLSKTTAKGPDDRCHLQFVGGSSSNEDFPIWCHIKVNQWSLFHVTFGAPYLSCAIIFCYCRFCFYSVQLKWI